MTQHRSASQAILDWTTIPPEELEAQFNPRVAVPEAPCYLEARAAESAKARAEIAGDYDLRYGPGPQQTFDLHRPSGAEGPTPALIFLHGGYWRALDKSDHTFVAPAFLAAGLTVVNMNYDLCPSVTLSELTEEVLDGIAHVARNADQLGIDPARIFVMGHSAGAHSAAMALAEDWSARGFERSPLRGAICKSGIYDAAAVRQISINAEVQLTPEIAHAMNALKRPPRPGPAILITAGGEEPPGWIGQSVAYHNLCQEVGADSRLEILPGANHFTVLSNAVDPSRPEHDLVMGFIRESC